MATKVLNGPGSRYRPKVNGRFVKKGTISAIQNLKLLPKDEENSVAYENEQEWREGRRIVELGFLADQLKECFCCKKPIELQNCIKERRYGLGSILYIECMNCKHINTVSTGKRHRREDGNKPSIRGMKIWDINTKVSMAYLDAGMGPVQTVNFLTALNIPPISIPSLKEREREIGNTFEKCAGESCQNALTGEIAMNRDIDNNESDEINVSFDGAWQKRGSGRCYSSLTGHATMIGVTSGKCVKYGLKSADCRKCSYVNEKGDADDHDCRKNFCGSAKSMESVLAVDMVKEIDNMGCKVASITMDDDSTTISRLRQAVNQDILKYSDKNHFRKTVSSDLYKLQEKHKRSLSVNVINYLTKSVAYALAQNKGKPSSLENNILAIVPHSFGDHKNCDTSWCNYHVDPDVYRHKSLPYGKDLTGEELFHDLSNLFSQYAKRSEKLSNLGSSQANESMNHSISAKAPKSKYFGGTQSLSYRIASAVTQKNEGRCYLTKINKAHALSPGKFTHQQRLKLDRKRKLEKEREKTPAVKRQRRLKKTKNIVSVKGKEIREGTTYSTAISTANDISLDTIEEIPPPAPRVPDNLIDIENTTPVFFDLETTGFGTKCDIIQIAAVYQNKTFNRYVLPEQPITASASKVTGFTKIGKMLFRKGEIMQITPKSQCIREFVSWLPENCVLYGHNSKAFDSRLIVKAIASENCMAEFEYSCRGFVDTLSLCRTCLPDRKKENKKYNQESLVHDVLGLEYDAHNAVGDVRSLKLLIEKLNIPADLVRQHSFSIKYTREYTCQLEAINMRTETFRGIPVSKGIIQKMAKSGLTRSHLSLAFKRGGVDGVENLLSELYEGRPRITKSKKIIESITSFLSSSV